MFSFLRLFSQRKYSLIFLVCLSVVALSFTSGVIQAASTSPSACAVTPSLLGGQGYRLSGQGYRLSGQGYRLSGQGFALSGQGFALSGQGVNLDPQVVAAEIVDNPVTHGQWVSDRLDFFTKRLGFNTDSAAIIIVDEFQPTTTGEEPHGTIVKQVVDDSIASLKTTYPTLKIASFSIDISDNTTNYNADAIANKISAKVTDLQGMGYHHFVLNMSFGLISCTDPGTATTPAFNFNDATKVVAANNQANPTLAIKPILECVVKVSIDDDDHHYGGKSRVSDSRDGGDSSSYIAYFGYKNDNDQLVSIPVGSNNTFSPLPQNRYQPTQFEPGRQKFVFGVKFGGSNLTWSLKGPDGETRTVTASKYSTPCSPIPPTPSQPVTPIVECVANPSIGIYEAHFGYNNPNTVGVRIAVGSMNQFTPAPADRGQLTTFAPGDHDNVFKVAFDGSNLSWTLGSITVTANASTQGCAEQEGFGLSQYITQNLGVPEDQLSAYWSHLAGSVTTDEFQALRKLLDQYLSDSADSKNFTAVTVASSGNLRPWLGDAPLAPASWKETIAVGATLDDGTNLWQFSQDANAVAPGVGYPLGDNSFAAGTSFAAPAFSVLVGMCSTVPTALKFDGINPPLRLDSSGNKVYDNSVIGTSDLAPLTCKPNSAPTITPISDRSDKEGTTVSFQFVATDPDGNTLTFSAVGLPPGVSISSQGLVSGKIADFSAKTYVVTVTVKDNGTPQGSASTSFNWVVTPAQFPVQIDIRPHSTKNRINLNSHGLVGVAIFSSSSPTFDATMVDPATVTLAGSPSVKKSNRFYTKTYDVNGDGLTDRVLWFEIQKLQLTATSTQAVLLGKTTFGVAFRGIDFVTIVPQRPLHLVAPASAATLSDSLVTLVWGDDEDWEVGDYDCFAVQISMSSGFSNLVQGAIVVDSETFVTKQLKNGTYYWRAAFSDCSSGTLGSWSDVGNFKVQR